MSQQTDIIQVFDNNIVRQHRDRAAASYGDHNFLMLEVADRMKERLDEINRDFTAVLDLGAHDGAMGRAINPTSLVSADVSAKMLESAGGERVLLTGETLPFDMASFDLVVSNLSLHWVNDLPGEMVQINRVLKPDGLFLASMFGGDTLHELRDALMLAELEVSGGVSPRISPFADVRDLGGLLQRAQFALPVADADTITVNYASPWSLLGDLRGMGETNAVNDRKKTFTSRRVLMRAMEIYVEKYAGEDGKVPATFQILYMTGWKAHESQQKPLRPGSATTRLADVLNTKEIKV